MFIARKNLNRLKYVGNLFPIFRIAKELQNTVVQRLHCPPCKYHLASTLTSVSFRKGGMAA